MFGSNQLGDLVLPKVINSGSYVVVSGSTAALITVDAQGRVLSIQSGSIYSELQSLSGAVATTFSTLDGAHIILGTPNTGPFSSGLFVFATSSFITDAIEQMDEALAALAPAQPLSMTGLTFTGGPTTHSGKPSALPVVPLDYFHPATGYTSGSSISTIVSSNSFTLTTATTGFSDADKGFLLLKVTASGTTNFSLSGSFNATLKGTNQTYPPSSSLDGKLTVTFVGIFNSFPLWQRGTAQINVSSLSGGYNSFEIDHVVAGSPRASTLREMFYDSQGAPVMVTPILSASSQVFQYLSGIKYIGTGSILQVSSSVSAAFNNTYLQQPLAYSFVSNGVAASTLDLTDAALAGFTKPIPFAAESFSVNNKQFTVNVANHNTNDEKITLTFTKPVGTSDSKSSVSQNMLVNTYSNFAGDLSDSLVDENYRLVDPGTYPSDFNSVPTFYSGTGTGWDPTAALTSGSAQVYNGSLVYPSINFTSGYVPTQTRDYSAFSGTRQVRYYRVIRNTGARSSGILTLGGLSAADIAPGGHAKVELKMPGVTGWKDLGVAFNPSEFTNGNPLITQDGQGIQSSVSGNTFNWSMGTASTSLSSNIYVLRITLNDSVRSVTSIAETG